MKLLRKIYYQNFSVLKLFHNIDREETVPNSFYEGSVTLIPKNQIKTAKRENYRPVFLMNIV